MSGFESEQPGQQQSTSAFGEPEKCVFSVFPVIFLLMSGCEQLH